MLTLPRGAATVPTDGPFDLVADLPTHPLVVHAVVVLLPLAAIVLVLAVLIPRARRTLGWIALVGLALGTVGAFVAKQSGEALAERVGRPAEHADLGGTLPLIAVITLLIAVGWFLLARRASRTGQKRSVPVLLAGVAAIVMSVALIVTTVLVGHSGAVATWSGTVAATNARPTTPDPTPTSEPSATASAEASAADDPTAAATGEPSATASADAQGTYTLAEVAEHADQTSCWAAIDGTVYDLTEWVGQHPGGANEILSICGTDATAMFAAQHGGEQRPAAELALFEIGTLSTDDTSAAAPADAVAAVTPIAFTQTPAAKKKTYTMAQVRKHNTATNCWAVINKGVYNLTTWVGQHPGGAGRIIALCGTNATAAFNAQHASTAAAKAQLAKLRIGTLRAARSA